MILSPGLVLRIPWMLTIRLLSKYSHRESEGLNFNEGLAQVLQQIVNVLNTDT